MSTSHPVALVLGTPLQPEERNTVRALREAVEAAGHSLRVLCLTEATLASLGKGFPTKLATVLLETPMISIVHTPPVQENAWRIYHVLTAETWAGIVLTNDDGVGYYTLLAKHQNLRFQECPIAIWQRTPTLKRLEQEDRPIDMLAFLQADFMERHANTLATHVWCEDKAVTAWAKANNWGKITTSTPAAWDLFAPGKPPAAPKKPKGKAAANPDTPVKVSVCVTHFNRPAMLEKALASLEAQNYPHVEIIVVDDGSTHPAALTCLDKLEKEFPAKGWQLIRQENKYLGAARNTAARHATGDFLLFMDDDNLAMPHEISTFVKVAQHTGADILTCVMQCFTDERPADVPPARIMAPLGASTDIGLFMNCYGDANALVRRSVFQKLEGFSEEYGVGYEDWEFFSRAALAGYHHEVIPDPLFYYREAPAQMSKNTPSGKNHARALRPFIESEYSSPLAIRMAHGYYLRTLGLEHHLNDLQPKYDHTHAALLTMQHEKNLAEIKVSEITHEKNLAMQARHTAEHERNLAVAEMVQLQQQQAETDNHIRHLTGTLDLMNHHFRLVFGETGREDFHHLGLLLNKRPGLAKLVRFGMGITVKPLKMLIRIKKAAG